MGQEAATAITPQSRRTPTGLPTCKPATSAPPPRPLARSPEKKREGGGDPKPRKRRGGDQQKRYTTRTPRHANKASSTTQTQRRRMASACTKATYRWTGICPSCSRTMVNATNANMIMQQRYRRPTRHQRMPKTLETIAPSPSLH